MLRFQFYQSESGLPKGHSDKESACQCRRRGLEPWVRKIPRRLWQPTPVFLPGEFHGQARRATACRVTESRTRLNAKLVWPHTYEVNLQRLGCQIRVRVPDMKKKMPFFTFSSPCIFELTWSSLRQMVESVNNAYPGLPCEASRWTLLLSPNLPRATRLAS